MLKEVLIRIRIRVTELALECGMSYNNQRTCSHVKSICHVGTRNQNMQDRQQRVESSQELLEVYNAKPEDFHTHLVT